ncbi:hypothetical protein PQR68_34510 [Paraburkholderia agricolaris]|uniref:hypothetical protein n=1 Tax=Paraburkholderia agricolaris TaxID=2152888 RepID=UPI0038BC418A
MMNKTVGILLSALLLRAGIANGIDPRAVGQQIQSFIISAAAHHGHASGAAGLTDVLPVMAQQGITTQAPQFDRRAHLPESAPAPFNPAQTAAYLAKNHIPTAEQAQEWALQEARRDRAWQEEVDAKFGLPATDQSSQ